MKKFRHLFLGLGTAVTCFLSVPSFAQQAQPNFNSPAGQGLRVGVVNMKRCLDESKLGKIEKGNFEKMEAQMESVLMEKQKAVEEIESKMSDEDYMDSISSEAETELKRKRRQIMQEGHQLKSQYLQTLQQANFKIAQKLTDSISKASELVAKESRQTNQPLDVILNDEAVTYFNPQLDISDRVITKMNMLYDSEPKDATNSLNPNNANNNNSNSNMNQR